MIFPSNCAKPMPGVTGEVQFAGMTYLYKDGLVHNENGPAIVDILKNKAYLQRGKLHRVGGPAIEGINGSQEWHVDGVLHRDDGPAVVEIVGAGVKQRVTEKWYQHGKLHRVDGPAVWVKGISEAWYLDGVLHRDGGPAVTRPDSVEAVVERRWYQHGKLHREDGPALTDDNGVQIWYRHGEVHRDPVEGPAKIFVGGKPEYWTNGSRYRGMETAIPAIDSGVATLQPIHAAETVQVQKDPAPVVTSPTAPAAQEGQEAPQGTRPGQKKAEPEQPAVVADDPQLALF